MPAPHRFLKSNQFSDSGRPCPKLHLLVTGFAVQEIVSTQEIITVIDKLPAFHLEQLREISYEPGTSHSACFAGLHNGQKVYRTGEYIQRSRKILIYYFDNRDVLFHMLLHEIGHHVFFLILNSKLKKHWVTQLHSSASFVTSYASHSPAEDFAETYAAYALNPNALRKIPSKFKFMQDAVFSGARQTLKEKN